MKNSKRGAGSTSVPNAWDDLKIRIVLGASFALSGCIFLTRAWVFFKNRITSDMTALFPGFSLVATGLFFLLLALLYAVRLRPIRKLAGIFPTAAAVLGTCFVWIIPLLAPPARLPFAVSLTATSLLLIGQLGAIFTLIYLGRSFSILPEGRKLVTSGPYRFIRHPLYLAEFFIMTGAALIFLSPWSVIIAALQVMLQFRRMDYEEKLLAAAFPEYGTYRRHTARLIPGIY